MQIWRIVIFFPFAVRCTCQCLLAACVIWLWSSGVWAERDVSMPLDFPLYYGKKPFKRQRQHNRGGCKIHCLMAWIAKRNF